MRSTDTVHGPSPSGRRPTVAGPGFHAVALGLFLVAEFLLFQRFNAASAWIYPRWSDQLQYLSEAYRGYEYSLEHGFLAGVWQTLVNTSAQGTLHDFWALLVFTLAGPSRAAAINVNMLWFLAAQAATFFTVRRVSGSPSAAWVALALLVALLGPWSGDTGSVTDFRLDWMAACAYGVALAAAVAGGGFASTKWAAAFGLAVGVTLLTRFLTGVYFGLIFVGLLGWILAQRDRGPRVWRLALACAVAFVIAAPIYWINRTVIYTYYWMGHVSGPEPALRDSHLGALESLRWILRELLVYKIGYPALFLVIVLLAVTWWAGRRVSPGSEAKGPPSAPLAGPYWMAAIFLLAPLIVLSIHPTKAPQTVTIMIIPAVFLAATGFAHLARRTGRKVAGWIGFCTLAAGSAVFAASVLQSPLSAQEAADARKMNALVDYVYIRSEECNLPYPRIAATLISDGVNADAFRVMGYERHHQWVEFLQTLPTGLFETTEDVVMKRLGESDFVCLFAGGELIWPYDRQLSAMSGRVRPWCDTHLVRLADLNALGSKVTFYERRGLGGEDSPRAAHLGQMLHDAGRAGGRDVPSPLAPPVLVSSTRILWSVDEPFLTRIRVAYSPVRYSITGLPDGLWLEGRTGTIRGIEHRLGEFTARVEATNSLGTVQRQIHLTFGKGPFLTSVATPEHVRAGVAADFGFQAYNRDGRLDFLDINDQSAGVLVARLSANEAERVGWQGRCLVTFSRPGMHRVNFRFVCFDPDAKDPYSFRDETRFISVDP